MADIKEGVISQKKLSEGLENLEENIEKDIEKKSIANQIFRMFTWRLILLLAVTGLFLLGLIEYSPGIFPTPPNATRHFLIETCVLSDGYRCKLTLHGKKASFNLGTNEIILQNVSTSFCESSIAPINNTMELKKCHLSPITNSHPIKLKVYKEVSHLSRTMNGRIVKLFEVTKLRGFILWVWNSILPS